MLNTDNLATMRPPKNGVRANDMHASKRPIDIFLPGILLAGLIAATSLFIEARLGGPVMLYALVIGVLFNPIAQRPSFESGLFFSADSLLKIGVALLGAKITLVDLADLGFQAAWLVILGVSATMIIGTAIGRALGLTKDHAILSAGSVAICGSSAALAIASVLPCRKDIECQTIVTVIVVTTLSTIAMVLYPLIATLLNLSDTQSGIFIGVTIHNVAQVVGAGFMISDPAGEIATVVKLMRVACLLPVIIIISLMFRHENTSQTGPRKIPFLPVFMIAFILIMLVNSLGFIPAKGGIILSEFSRWALVIAVAALGVKTSVKDIAGVGVKPVLVLGLQTLFLAVLAFAAIGLFLPP